MKRLALRVSAAIPTSRAVLFLTHVVPVLATDTSYLRRRLQADEGDIVHEEVVEASDTRMGKVQPQTNGNYENNTDEAGVESNVDDSSSPPGGGVPLDGEFFLMFFFVLLIVFAVLFLPVIWKFFKAIVLERRIDGDAEEPKSKKQTERSKDDVLDGVALVKKRIAEESRQVRYANKASADESACNGEERYVERQQNQNIEPRSGTYYGTYYFNNKARVEKMNLTFAPHPHGGYVVLGSGEVQSGETEISEGYMAPDGEAYFVEMGGVNPNAVDMDISDEELTSRRLHAREVSDLIVLYTGKFDFTQSNTIFTGCRYSSTGINRKYHLLLRPRDSTIRHVLSTITSSLHSRPSSRRSSAQFDLNDESKEEEGETIEWTGQQGYPGFPCVSKA